MIIDKVVQLIVVALKLNVQQFTFIGLFTLILKEHEACSKSQKEYYHGKEHLLAERNKMRGQSSHGRDGFIHIRNNIRSPDG